MEKWTKERILANLDRSDTWLYRSLEILYQRQTADEQISGATRHHNGMGFNGRDAGFLTSSYKFYKKAGFLTPKHRAAVRKCIRKYAGQLADVANQKQAEKAEQEAATPQVTKTEEVVEVPAPQGLSAEDVEEINDLFSSEGDQNAMMDAYGVWAEQEAA